MTNKEAYITIDKETQHTQFGTHISTVIVERLIERCAIDEDKKEKAYDFMYYECDRVGGWMDTEAAKQCVDIASGEESMYEF